MGIIVSIVLLDARYGTEREKMGNHNRMCVVYKVVDSPGNSKVKYTGSSSALGLKGWRLFDRLGGETSDSISSRGIPTSILILKYRFQQPRKGDRGLAFGFRAGSFGRAAFYDRQVLPFGDPDWPLLLHLKKSAAILAVPDRRVIPPRSEKKRKKGESQRPAKRTSEKRKTQRKSKSYLALGHSL